MGKTEKQGDWGGQENRESGEDRKTGRVGRTGKQGKVAETGTTVEDGIKQKKVESGKNTEDI